MKKPTLPATGGTDGDLTRRELLALLGAGALIAMLPAPLDAAPALATGGVEPFALSDVRLLDGPFRDAQERNTRYLLSLDPDRLLHNFRMNAGLAPKAPVYGGWESQEPWVGIRCHGHTLGHYLSAVAMMVAATGDAECARRTRYIVSELRACQQARGDGLTCAFPDNAAPLEDAIAGRPFAGVPWYTMHKIFAGVRDAHIYAAAPDAMPVLIGLADWTWQRTRDMSDSQMQHMLDTEHGGMTEVLADVSALTGDRKYLALARRFAHQKVLVPLAEGQDVLDGLHSNTLIPKIIGFQRVRALDGDATYGAAASNFWQLVTGKRSYVTGGNADGEHFFPPAEFAKRINSAKTMETCCTHNMLRLSRALFAESPSSAYADFYERALYNGILASQDPDSGMMTYFQATRPGYVRLFHTPEDSFWCCTGTGMENHTKYGDSIYFRGRNELYVNLFIPSTLEWKARGLTLRQETRFPDVGATRISIARATGTQGQLTVCIRRPHWCDAVAISVNGRRVNATLLPSGYLAITRAWRAGDVIDVQLPMTTRTESLPGAPGYVAFVHGPIVLAGRMGTAGMTRAEQIIVNERTSGNMLNAPIDVPTLASSSDNLAQHVRPVQGESLQFETVGIGKPADVSLAPFYRLAHERYNLYWKVES